MSATLSVRRRIEVLAARLRAREAETEERRAGALIAAITDEELLAAIRTDPAADRMSPSEIERALGPRTAVARAMAIFDGRPALLAACRSRVAS